MRREVEAVEHRASFRRVEYRRLSGSPPMPGPRTQASRRDGTRLSQDERVEPMANQRSCCFRSGRALACGASIDVAIRPGCTAAIDGTPAIAHQAEITPPLEPASDAVRKSVP
jgi:hypothetical protein